MIQNNRAGLGPRRHRFRDFNLEYFWSWDDFSSYIEFLLCLCAVIGVCTAVLGSNVLFAEGLGVLALGVESTLALPQVYRNHAKQSTSGLK